MPLKKLMAQVDQLEKQYYCPLKSNRRVDDTGGTVPYALMNSIEVQEHGSKRAKIRGFPKDKKESIPSLFLPTLPEFVATNDDSRFYCVRGVR